MDGEQDEEGNQKVEGGGGEGTKSMIELEVEREIKQEDSRTED